MRNLPLVAIILLFISCSDVKTSDIQVQNNTRYHFHDLQLKLGDSVSFALKPFTSSEIIKMKYPTSWANFFAPGHVGIWYGSYSDSSSVLEYDFGSVIRKDFLEENELNTIVITVEETDEVRFRSSLQ